MGIQTRKKKLWMHSKMASHGWIRTLRQMPKRSRRNTKRLKVFARRSYQSTIKVVVAAVVAVVETMRLKRKRMMSYRSRISCEIERNSAHCSSSFQKGTHANPKRCTVELGTLG